jgi:UDP-glucose 6-dehydrogenase
MKKRIHPVKSGGAGVLPKAERFNRVKIGIIGVGWVGGILLRWLCKSGWRRGRNLFCFDADLKKGMRDDLAPAEIIFICVPTPSKKEDGSCDISIVHDAVRRFAVSDKLLVIRSTVAIGTTEMLARRYGVAMAFNPEFLTEQNAWNDFIRPDRQVIGVTPSVTSEQVGRLFDILPHSENKFVMSATEAEIVKYGANAFGAQKVVFANTVKDYCDAFGADYENVRRAIAADKRIGDSWMDVGHGAYRGYGGFCYPKDVRAKIVAGEKRVLEMYATGAHAQAKLLDAAIDYYRAGYRYNALLLETQGLTVEQVSGHIDAEQMKKLEQRKGK